MKHSPEPLRPETTIGILGGGQLAQMLVLAGHAMGFQFVVLEPTSNCPAARAGAQQIQSSYDDAKALKKLADCCSVITYEFENVNTNSVIWLEKEVDLPQGSELLRTTQNRLLEKTHLLQLDIPVTPFLEIRNQEDLQQALEKFGDLMLKTVTGGYDGKGQIRLNNKNQISATYSKSNPDGRILIAEKFISFEREISVMVARNRLGEIKCFPVSENGHENSILTISRIPARLNEAVTKEAIHLAYTIAEGLDLCGILGVEFFVMSNGDLCVNELAPRPHNSGHFTQNACGTSQFEQHLRAIMNWPLASTHLQQPVVMLNILGQHLPKVLNKLDLLPANANLHLYAKQEARTGRKMGHINFLTDQPESLLNPLLELDIWNEKALLKMLDET